MTRVFVILSATPGGTRIDLREIFESLPSSADHLLWSLRSPECFGPSAIELELIAASSKSLSTAALRHLADGIEQSIDADLLGVDAEGCPQVLIRAVDGSSWDVVTDDPELAAAIDAREMSATEYFAEDEATDPLRCVLASW